MQSRRNQCRSELVACVALEVVGLVVGAAVFAGCGGNDASGASHQSTNAPGEKRSGTGATGSSTTEPNADGQNANDPNANDPNAAGPSAADPNAGGPSANSPSAPSQEQPVVKADPHPAWVVGTYENPGKIEDNIPSGQKSIT